MREIEVKILEVSRREIEKKLVDLGAKKVFDDVMEAEFFDTKSLKLRKRGETFRIRKEGKKTLLVHKTKIESKSAKVRDEVEVEVSDFGGFKKMIESFGFRKVSHSKKRRVSYLLNDVKFDFDKFLGKEGRVPEFLEIEARDVKTLYKYVKLLGFKKEDCRDWGKSELLKYYSKKR